LTFTATSRANSLRSSSVISDTGFFGFPISKGRRRGFSMALMHAQYRSLVRADCSEYPETRSARGASIETKEMANPRFRGAVVIAASLAVAGAGFLYAVRSLNSDGDPRARAQTVRSVVAAQNGVVAFHGGVVGQGITVVNPNGAGGNR
jgi:hypothetical protein